MIGQTLGPYRITAEVARGGQATLYKAVHTVLGRETALKVLHPHLITVADFLQKFEAESKILARLKHPNIVTVYDAGVDNGMYWIAMEWLDGQAVDDLIAQQGKLLVDLAVRIADQMAAALEYAHAQGLIHRDIKPGNMMLLPDGTVKVLDFGIAAIIAAGQKAVTRIGTVEYMSYEQFNGQADYRSDLYSLGASLYEMLTGQLPPKLALHPPTPPRQLNPAVPLGLEQLLCRLLDQQPKQRLQTATVLRQELHAALTATIVQPAPAIRCLHCGTDNRVGAGYCRACGKALAPKGSIGKGPLESVEMIRIAGPIESFEPKFRWSPQGELLAATIAPTLLVPFAFTQTEYYGRTGKEHIGILVAEQTIPEWSPDSTRAAFVRAENHKIGALLVTHYKYLHRHTADAPLCTEQLTWGDDTDDDMPAWSPDSRFLLYRATVRTTGWRQWRLMDLATRQIHRLEHAAALAWSPDGRCSAVANYPLIVRVYDPYGQLLFENEGSSSIRGQFREVTWLDNRRLIVTHFWTGRLGDAGSAVSVFDVKLETWQELLRSVSRFVVSPDRLWLAVVASKLAQDEESWIQTVKLISTNDYTVTELHATSVRYGIFDVPRFHALSIHGWAPDSTKVLFTKGQEIWAVNVNDTGLQRITEGYAPQWSPDGRHIAFLRSPKEREYELWVMRVEPA